MHSAVYDVATCLSVSPSVTGVRYTINTDCSLKSRFSTPNIFKGIFLIEALRVRGAEK